MATLIKVDRNGSKHYEGLIECPKCGGIGLIAHHIENGVPSWQWTDGGICWKCGGKGKIFGKWIERTPEYQAKLDARREAKLKAKQERAEKLRKEAEAKAEAERLAEEARIKAEKAISQYVGEIKQRMTMMATYEGSAHYEINSFYGYGKDVRYIHQFRDADKNLLVWKTGSPLDRNVIHEGDVVELTGTVKEHTEYRDEKQTVLTRCKVKEVK